MSQNIAQILLQSLEKKNQVLDEIIAQNELQEELLKKEELDMDAVDASVQSISELVDELEKLDDGFESVYDRVRTEIMENKEMYRAEITQMQDNIQQITDKVVKINAVKMRNQLRADSHFKQKAQEIKKAVSKTKAAKNYYNSMNKLNYVAPQFYDNKK